MINITHLWQAPLPLFNKLEEVRVRSRMGLSMCVLASPKIENSKVF
jgi:hypothetical protein